MRPLIDYGREDIVKFLYLEQLLQEQRVLVLGPENEVVSQIFNRMGCRSVKHHMPGEEVLPDWDLASLRGKRDSIEESKRLLPLGKGSFDIVFIPDLAAIGDYRLVLSECARITAESGLVIISARNAECTVAISQSGLEETPDIWSLDSIEDLTRTYFEHVENVGQCPFLAYACVSYDPGRASEGVRLDTSLMEERSEEPEFYLVLCSHRPLATKISNAIYQVPVLEMTLAEAPEETAAGGDVVDTRGLKVESEMLKKEVAGKNVLISRLKKEIERIEGEAEDRRHKMFEMKQKMERERKSLQKDVLEKAIRKQVDKIPETWIREREVLVKEIEQLKKDYRILKSENGKLETEVDNLEKDRKKQSGRASGGWKRDQEALRREIEVLRSENRDLANGKRRLKNEVDSLRKKTGSDADKSVKTEIDGLKKKLAAKEQLVEDLLHELELMPQVGFGDDVPSGEEDVLELIGKMEDMKKTIAENGEVSARLSSRVHDLQLTLEEEKVRVGTAARENGALKERVKELVATTNMMSDLAAAIPESSVETFRKDVVRINAIIKFCLEELKCLAERRREERVGRELALLWAKVEEKRRMVVKIITVGRRMV